MTPNEFTESPFDTAPCSVQEMEAFEWEPSPEDRQWAWEQEWAAMTS